MYVPAGRTVQLQLSTSPDVIHAFYVPQFLFKRDVVPGRTNPFEFNGRTPTEAGQTFRGQCAELCGVRPLRSCCSRSRRLTADRLRRLARRARSPTASATPPPPRRARRSGARPPSGPPGRTRSLAGQRARTSQYRADRRCTAPADAPFQIEFDEQGQPASPHNVEIHQGADRRRASSRARSSAASARKTYDVPALPAGDLRLRVHGPPEHDRHPHGRTEEPPVATTALHPAAPTYRARSRSTSG